jgi:hypothetical protein
MSQLQQLLVLIEKLPAGRFVLRRLKGGAKVTCLSEADEPGDAAMAAAVSCREHAGQASTDELDFLPVRWQVRSCDAFRAYVPS